MAESAIITRVLHSLQQLPAKAWNDLLAHQACPTPFMRHEYLCALEQSASAVPDTGWGPCVLTLWQGEELVAACMLYAKSHSYGEYVFDWAWARAYEQHGLAYYPKGLVAVPFTPVPGSRLLARSQGLREALVRALQDFAQAQQLSSLHLLFGDEADLAACASQGWMQRSNVQFHWSNRQGSGYTDFDDFLAALSQDKRKKIRQERRKVSEAGVRFRALHGPQIGADDLEFFYRCYERTYLEHGNAPYLSPQFFALQLQQMPQAWLLFIAERHGQPIASSLIALSADAARHSALNKLEIVSRQALPAPESIAPSGTAYGRYWGALERVDCLHFEACYYQPLAWCIERGIASFEGGAQGEHKMARALLPQTTPSAHWIAHPSFAEAIERFLEREGQGMARYLDELQAHSPLRRPAQDICR
ncbi:GNAT family N-acetyltransferase [Comamonas composti]|uniref:GNAT family N-acetyltransferase n=1 Tax=Comamonas composti TaxID=408558 RepID=UPI0004127425|nr:GNAT family N-acetyltransferase [Comamonas composti]